MRRFAGLLLLAWAGTASGQDVRIEVGKDHVAFYAGQELVTRYYTSGFAKPIFWPLHAPGGIPLTRSWPMEKGLPGETTDHPHQKSAWFCHGDVIPEGLDLKQKIKGVEGVDFWSEATGHGKMVCVEVGKPQMTRNGGFIVTKNEWRTADDIKILEETRTIYFYNFGSARLFVIVSDLFAPSHSIVFGDTKEGSMGIRINDLIAEKNGKGKLQNAEGKVGEKACWGFVSDWCDYSGPLNGKVVGLAILADAKNPHPTAWHSRGYGLMAANPFGRNKSGFPSQKGKTDLVRVERGQHLVMRYGLLLHEGDAEQGKVADHYRRFMELR